MMIPVDRFVHTAIRASAGSGKTFQLTNRYLQLIAGGVEPHTILATTFTRLAAGQIRDRILLRLAEAADQPKKRAELAEHLGVDRLSRQAVIDLLTLLARRLHQVQIRTLDSFFASVVRSFAIELNLPVGADVVDEDVARQLREDAIRLMLDERDPQELVDLLRLLTQGSAERGVMSTIDSTITGMYPLFLEADASAWTCVSSPPGRLGPKDLVSAIQTLETVVCSDGRHAKAHAEACERARRWDWEAFISAGLAKAIATGQSEYYRKPIEPHVLAAYEPLVRHARAELVGRVRDQTIATRDLLALFHEQYEKLKHIRHAITFDDLTAAMARAEKLGTLSDIGFRLDAHLHHLLLDEFQDTSIPQWRALEPIALELVSQMPPLRTFFCVGDVKQSIYGWRDAAPEVLDELPRLLAGPDGGGVIELRELAVSWRSSPVVIDVVNQVFESIDHNAALAEFPDAVSAWQPGFAHHDTARRELPGYVELRVAPQAAEGQEKDVLRFAMAADLVASLHRRNTSAKIAVLTRTNDGVARLLYELGPSRRNVPASGRGGGPLTDAPVVNVILDLLQLADHPDDTAAAFNVANSPLGEIVGLHDWRDAVARARLSHRMRLRLIHEGYCATLAGLAAALAPSCDQRELRRLMQLVELAGTHDTRATLRANDFIELVETTAVADIQPAPVQVITIHQAKGLEFDAVVLPELEGALAGSNAPPVVFDRSGAGETGPITRICRYMNKDVLALAPELQPLFDRHKRRTVRESLSLLYVAMTRAIHGLYMLIDPPSKNEKTIPKKLSSVLRCALIPAGAKIEPEQVMFSHGNAGWIEQIARSEKLAKPQAAETASPAQVDRISLAPSPAREIAAASRGAAATAASAIDQHLRLPDLEAVDRGQAMHALLREIEWIEDFNLNQQRDVLLRIAMLAAPRRDEAWATQQVERFLKAIQLPAVRNCLSRPHANGADGSFSVLREHPFAQFTPTGLQSGVIDRLVIQRNAANTAVAATVIDFKTNSLEPSEAAAAAEQYRAQMQAYRTAVTNLTGLAPAKISLTVLFTEPGVAVEL